MNKKVAKNELLEKLEAFRKNIKYYQDTLGKGLDECNTRQSTTTPDQIIKATSHLRQTLRKSWGYLEKYYTNLGLTLALPSEKTEKTLQNIDIFYHSFSENFFHDVSIIKTLDHALQTTDIAIGKCEGLTNKEINKLEKKSLLKKSNKLMLFYIGGFFVLGIIVGYYINYEKTLEFLKHLKIFHFIK